MRARVGILIHADVCGPINPVSLSGKCYSVTFTDDCSRFVWVRFIRYKSEVFQKFRDLIKELEKGTGRKLKALRSDRGGEFFLKKFWAEAIANAADVRNRSPTSAKHDTVRGLVGTQALSESFEHVWMSCLCIYFQGKTAQAGQQHRKVHVSRLQHVLDSI